MARSAEDCGRVSVICCNNFKFKDLGGTKYSRPFPLGRLSRQ